MMHAMPRLDSIQVPSDMLQADADRHDHDGTDPSFYEANVYLIESKHLIGECLIAGLCSASSSMRFMLFSDVDLFSGSSQRLSDAVILMRAEIEPTSSSTEMSKIEKLKAFSPQTPLILISDVDSPHFVAEALRLGAAAVIPTSMPLRVVVRVLQLVLAGGVFVPVSSFRGSQGRPDALSRAPKQDIGKLSPRQVLVAKALRKGTSNKVIAYDLNMCESTVKVHVRQIMKKLNARNRTQVAFLTNEMFVDEA